MPTIEQNKRNKILLGQDNNALTWLIIVNAVVFVSLIFVKVIYLLSNDGVAIGTQLFHNQVTDYVFLPAKFSTLPSRPWTVILYMFAHENVWYFISSLLWLWCFGYILQDLAGNDKLIPLYLYGGFFGACFFLLGSNLIPSMQTNINSVQPLIGAGASVMAVAIATTTLTPGFRIFPLLNGGIPLWVLTLIFVAIDFATMASASSGYALAHIAAGAVGFLYVQQLRKGNDWGAWMLRFANWFDNLFNPEKKHIRKPLKQEHFYKATRKPYEKTPNITQQKLDEILDKINQKGYHFLTDEEKEFLNKASKEEL